MTDVTVSAANPVTGAPTQTTPQQGQPTQHVGMVAGWVNPQHQQTTQTKSAAVDAQQPANTTPTQPTAKPAAPSNYTVSYDDIGQIDDPVVRSMAMMFQTVGKGLDADRVLGNAIRYGDPGLIDTRYITEKGGENAHNLIAMARGIVEGVTKQAQAFETSVYDTVGGKGNWDVIVGVFNSKAPAEVRATVARMLDSKDALLIKQGAAMVAEYGKSSGLVPQLGTQFGATAMMAANSGGLTKEAFQAAIRQLNQNAPDYNTKINALMQRRELGKKSGLR